VSSALVVELGGRRRCLSCAVLGGGLCTATHWLNVQVPAAYARLDPAARCAAEARARSLDPAEVIGMLTAADVRAVQTRRRGVATAHATVGIGQPLAAAGRRPRAVPAVGTINVLVVLSVSLADSALAAAVQTATEAKAQALADAGVSACNHAGHATGTATDSICVASVQSAGSAGASEPFAGPATPTGAAIATAVHGAILAGAASWRRSRREVAR